MPQDEGGKKYGKMKARVGRNVARRGEKKGWSAERIAKKTKKNVASRTAFAESGKGKGLDRVGKNQAYRKYTGQTVGSRETGEARRQKAMGRRSKARAANQPTQTPQGPGPAGPQGQGPQGPGPQGPYGGPAGGAMGPQAPLGGGGGGMGAENMYAASGMQPAPIPGLPGQPMPFPQIPGQFPQMPPGLGGGQQMPGIGGMLGGGGMPGLGGGGMQPQLPVGMLGRMQGLGGPFG